MTARCLRPVTLALGVVLCVAAAATAAPPETGDPDWPCQQIKVPQLSLASVWSGPPVDQELADWQHDQAIADLVQEIARRREPIAQAQARLHAFAAQSSDQRQQKLLQVLAGLFSVLDGERSTVIAGLDRFGARQKELAAGIREDNDKLRKLQADPGADASEVNQMVQRITWEAEVFQDRRQALSYACDAPSKIEQRLFALARTIQEELQ
jgi:hypothetical protein